ncbi:type I-F CRISPR-associated endonuclease Cas1f [Candidatus Enterovibrio escicola]|uniref:type I-F CRISPR-associated endonuclease Cas1f n=1 Tax=Candidatus Enterovibrio escicola TaxID=1927127 RepID=UPI001CC268F0|nr:type I-F CRISPR-associated endonuclease Cas1f [Candidatus Enterovibrio escacola]
MIIENLTSRDTHPQQGIVVSQINLDQEEQQFNDLYRYVNGQWQSLTEQQRFTQVRWSLDGQSVFATRHKQSLPELWNVTLDGQQTRLWQGSYGWIIGDMALFPTGEIYSSIKVSWLTPQSEYRPTEYLQQWVRFWFDDALRLEAAKQLQQERIRQVKKHWLKASKHDAFPVCVNQLNAALSRFTDKIETCTTTQDLLSLEATTTKTLYRLACYASQYGDFTRSERGYSNDIVNRFLDQGNYLAYGLAATA